MKSISLRIDLALSILLAVTMVSKSARAQDTIAAWEHSAYGDTLLRPFPHAPYPHPSRANGHTYDGKTFSAAEHYSDSTIGIFIPVGFKPGETVDYVVHFHGWSNNVAGTFERYQLRQQMADSKVNAILIVPEGPKDAQDSGGGKLELDPGAFKLLMEEVSAFLKQQGRILTTKIGKIVLSTHSGGYAVTSAILFLGGLTDHITDVLLFDSSYGGLDRFADWASAGHKRRLVSIFTAHLAPENYMLITLLQKSGTKYDAFMESQISESQLLARRPIFFHTLDIEHDEIMQKKRFFTLFLKTSALPKASH